MSNDLYALAGAYVLDALDEEERATFEAFLETSPEARAEVESLREVAALLGTAALETPPASLKRSVMAEIDTVRQLPPVVTSLDDARVDRTARPRSARPATREWVVNLTRGVAAVAAVIAIGLGVAVAQLGNRLDSLEAMGDQVATVVAAADAQQVSVALPDGGRVSAVISPDQGSAIVVGDQLGTLSDDQMYALWGIIDDVPIPIGEMVDGRAVAVDLDGLRTLGITVEPRGPLSVPTSDPIGVLSV